MIKTEPIVIRSVHYVEYAEQWDFTADSTVEGELQISFTAPESGFATYTAFLALRKHIPVCVTLNDDFYLQDCEMAEAEGK